MSYVYALRLESYPTASVLLVVKRSFTCLADQVARTVSPPPLAVGAVQVEAASLKAPWFSSPQCESKVSCGLWPGRSFANMLGSCSCCNCRIGSLSSNTNSRPPSHLRKVSRGWCGCGAGVASASTACTTKSEKVTRAALETPTATRPLSIAGSSRST
jgi:hypothetical protein